VPAASGSGMYFTNSMTGYSGGGSGIIGKTIDGGNSLIIQNGNVPDNINSLFFLNNNNGYAVGNNGAITKTTNGGINWIPQTRITSNNLNTIYFVNESTGYISGDFGTALRTTNGGLVFVNLNENLLIKEFSLSQNYPNPFNSSTIIKYNIKEATKLSLKIFSIDGKELFLLVNEYQSIGNYEVMFDASNLNSGIYFYSIFSNNNLLESKKLIIIK